MNDTAKSPDIAPKAVLADDALRGAGARRLIRFRLIRNGFLGVVGIALLVFFALAADHYASDSASLRDTGSTVSGTVVEVVPGASAGYAMVSYEVAGKKYTEHVDLGDLAADYAVADTVDVYYDPNKPSHMTINDIDNQPAGTVLPMAMSLVLGTLLVTLGPVRFTKWFLVRRRLSRVPWRSGYLARPRVGGMPDRLARPAEQSLVRLPLYGQLRVRPPGMLARTADAGLWVVVGNPEGSWLILTRRARTDRQASRWSQRWDRSRPHQVSRG